MMTRTEYMNTHAGLDRVKSAALHRAYYAQFVNAATIGSVVSHIGRALLLQSKDPHLNDIPLDKWDRVGAYMPMDVTFRSVGDYATKAGLVCVAKEAARQWIESQSEAKP